VEELDSIELNVCDRLGVLLNDPWFVEVDDFEELTVVLGEADKDT
jgi:hypothetical protein